MRKLQVIKNVSSSWIMLATNIVVGIFLAPFILHHLGDAAFGIWVLIFSITGYYGLFDFGIRSSVLRYFSRSLAANDREELGKIINTSLFSYSCVGALTFVFTLVLVPHIDKLFHITPDFDSTARSLLLMVGGAVALGFPLEISGSLLEGLQRFDIVNLSGIVATALRGVLIVIVLRHGGGILTVALITVAVPLITSIIRGVIVYRLCPLPFGWQYVDRSTFKKMAGYSSITFMTIVAGRLKFKTDEIIIGSMMSAAAITYFNIGARIVDYAGLVVLGVAQIFLPMSSQSEAVGNTNALRRILILGNRSCSLVILPICATLVILGKSIIEVWVGQRYVATSYPVLVILILATTLMWMQGASTRVLFGMGRHGMLAVVTLVEGIANVALSVLLIRPYGIIGDSLGTAIPMFCSMVFFLPWHMCHQLGVRMSAYLREAYSLPLALCVPMVVVMLLLKHWFVPHNYWQLAFHLTVSGLTYSSGLAWAFSAKRLTHVSPEAGISTELTPTAAVLAADGSF